MKSRILTALVALVFAIIGWVLSATVGAHLLADHANLHALVAIEAQRQQAMQPQAKPAPPAEVK